MKALSWGAETVTVAPVVGSAVITDDRLAAGHVMGTLGPCDDWDAAEFRLTGDPYFGHPALAVNVAVTSVKVRTPLYANSVEKKGPATVVATLLMLQIAVPTFLSVAFFTTGMVIVVVPKSSAGPKNVTGVTSKRHRGSATP